MSKPDPDPKKNYFGPMTLFLSHSGVYILENKNISRCYLGEKYEKWKRKRGKCKRKRKKGKEKGRKGKEKEKRGSKRVK